MKSFRKNDKKKIIKIGVFLLLFVFIIGYAYLTQNLNITGTSNFARTTWNIHFENLQDNTNMTLGQNDSAAAITQNKTNEVTYSISFNEPGQFYEFTVDAKNDGTIDVMIDNIVSTIKIGDGEVTPITTNPSNLPAYMAYSVTYCDGVQKDVNAVSPGNTVYTIYAKPTFGEEFPTGSESFATSAALNNFVNLSGDVRDRMGLELLFKI